MVLLRPRTSADLTAAFEYIEGFRQIPTSPTKANAYQRDQRQTNRIPKKIPVTPHALKLLPANGG
jgi:hypothetical protein